MQLNAAMFIKFNKDKVILPGESAWFEMYDTDSHSNLPKEQT